MLVTIFACEALAMKRELFVLGGDAHILHRRHWVASEEEFLELLLAHSTGLKALT